MAYNLCPECGNNLGELRDLYKVILICVNYKNAKKLNVKIDKISLLDNMMVDERDKIMSALGIDRKKICCRMKLSTSLSQQDLVQNILYEV